LPDTKISDDPSAGTLDGTEIVPVVAGGANKRTTAQAIADLGGGGGGGGSGLWSPVLSAIPTLANTGLGTWLNQGGATANDRATGISISAPSNSGDAIRGRYKAAPATPYTIKALVGVTCSPANFNSAGIGWYDGTNKSEILLLIYNGGWKLQIVKMSTPTSNAGDDYGAQLVMGNPLWMRIRDDGTTIDFGWSISGDDDDFVTLYSVAKASGYLGAAGYSNVMFFANRAGTSPATPTIGSLLSWNQS
jgi:hypothetical protein